MSKTKELLPFPRLVEEPAACLGCGYPLEGIPAPGFCPECGLGFDAGLSGVMLAGVARKQGGPLWRKFVWTGIGVLAFLFTQVIAVILFSMPWLSLVIFLVIVASTLGMALTGKRNTSGSEHFVFTRHGFSRWFFGSDNAVREFVVWSEGDTRVFVKRISRVWATIKIVMIDSQGKRAVLLDSGFRCRGEELMLIEQMLSTLTRGESLGDPHSFDGFTGSSLEYELQSPSGRDSELNRGDPGDGNTPLISGVDQV